MFSTGCHVCRCHWLSKEAADEYNRRAEGHNVEFSGTPAALSPEAPLERRVGLGAQED
jgi:hypothetical protein